MARLDSMSAWPAFLLGAFLPNYVIVVAVVGDVLQAGLSQVWTAVVLTVVAVVLMAKGLVGLLS